MKKKNIMMWTDAEKGVHRRKLNQLNKNTLGINFSENRR